MNSKKKLGRGAVIIVLIDGDRFMLVWDGRKPLPIFWKFPGGKIEDFDVDPRHPLDDQRTAYRAALRETKEETTLDAQHLVPFGVIDEGGFKKHLFVGTADFSKAGERGQDGEVPRAFTLQEIRQLPNFLRHHHRRILKRVVKMIRGRELRPLHIVPTP